MATRRRSCAGSRCSATATSNSDGRSRRFDFYERALKIAATVPELQMPFMTLVGKADALVKLGRLDEAEELVKATLAEAAKEGSLGLPGGADASPRFDRSGTETDRPGSRRVGSRGGIRPRGRWQSHSRRHRAGTRADFFVQPIDCADAERAFREGIPSSRSMGERLLLPRLLAQLADVQLSTRPPR